MPWANPSNAFKANPRSAFGDVGAGGQFGSQFGVQFSGGVALNSIAPFDYDINTFWFDSLNAINTVDTVGLDTYKSIPDFIRQEAEMVNPTKDYQLLVGTEGFEDHLNSGRSMSTPTLDGVANGINGCYMAANILPISSGSTKEFWIFSNGSIALHVPSNRQIGFKATPDIGSFNWAYRAPAITLGVWLTVEMQMDYDNNLATFWYNGVEQSLAYNSGLTYSPATTDRSLSISGGEGQIQQTIYQDRIPLPEMRQSISDYLISVRP